MFKPNLNFTQDDIIKHKLLDEQIAKLASWQGNTKDIALLYQGLVWYANLIKKIEANIIEVQSVKQAYKPEETENVPVP